MLSIFDELRPVFEVLTPTAHGWSRERIAGVPEIGPAHVWRLDEQEAESNGDLLMSAEDPLTPTTLLLAHPPAAPEILKRAPQVFDATGLVVTRHEAVASDGVRIPYVQVGPRGETGEAPVHLRGYGRLPRLGSAGLQRRHRQMLARARRHQRRRQYPRRRRVRQRLACRRDGKRLSHDDFAAIATDLVRRGVTRPGRIAAEGGSNGGLLVANMLTRYPERFGALFCTIPLIDMRRYTKLLAGASWIAEYGDPDKPEDWAFLREISAYHQAAPRRSYPPILIATTRRDDRVHAAHARKMAAKLLASDGL